VLDEINQRLKAAKLGIRVVQRGDRLSLRATLPPRPDSGKTKPYQQYLSLGIYANPAGFKRAEAEAYQVASLLAVGKFDWSEYLLAETAESEVVPIAKWIERLEEQYFSQRARTKKTQNTWDKEYSRVLSKLPADSPLTLQLLLELIHRTPPDTRARRRTCYAARALARMADLDLDIGRLIGNYSPQRASPRDLPSDELIAQWRDKIPNPAWQWVYGMLATYGLRNHEIFHLDLDTIKEPPGIVSVTDEGKTDAHRVWPCYPEWWERWQLWDVKLPEVSGKHNSDLGHQIYVQFRRYGLPFNPYDLRHAWAVRTLYFGWDISLAAAQMGHSVAVHCSVYHRWITDRHHQRAFEILMNRSDGMRQTLCFGGCDRRDRDQFPIGFRRSRLSLRGYLEL
jgi:integrase